MNSRVSVVIMAAGLGTRMRSRMAKVLHSAGGQTLVEHVLDAAAAIAPPERTYVVIGYQADEVRALLTPRGVRFIHQERQLGTGHAVMCGERQLQGNSDWMVVLNGDGPLLRPETLTSLVNFAASREVGAVMITADLEDPTGYGRVIRDQVGRVAAIVEEKAGTPEQLAVKESNTGQYCFRSDLFWKHVTQLLPNNPAKEYYLTDMIGILIQAGHAVEAFKVADASELTGINNRVELARVDATFRERKVRQLMLDGVTVQNPETVTVDARVKVGMDTIIEPFARLLGVTQVGENCRIGAHSILMNAEIEGGVTVHPFSMVQEGRLCSGAQVGPYSRIRPGSTVGPGAHVGNFVELKKTHVGAGAKAMHLAYLGDCTVGERTNIGAGTITCNFDGVDKHQTGIGKDAFVGSNATLVAPVEVEDGSYIAAGSVITERVPAGSLALGRARQVVKQGWVEKRRGPTGSSNSAD
jgi:bifunctional UDP-N-acetylglucosamine pyrophosphorylase/glucosamine-1-phosphate N-acetyltransferase